ncbi:MAG: chemotaxis protein CheW [Stygiobacter sp.]|nr:MAG: chemotaxis protein CheW [Stygiobacter sp.]KAF0215521.1 MAG: chemotaxis protein [Ignavibacteria bacterium]
MKSMTIESNDLIQLVSFKLGNEEFGIDIGRVQEINMMMQLTKIPNSNQFIEGVVNLRGKIVPVVNLRERLGLCKKEDDSRTKIIVSDVNNKLIGYIVDEVNEVLRISKSIIEPTPEIISGVNSDLIEGVAKLEGRLLILLNLDKLLSTTEINQLQQIEE